LHWFAVVLPQVRPARHLGAFGQHGSLLAPQQSPPVPTHMPPVLHVPPGSTQRLSPGSQQFCMPPIEAQTAPAQQACRFFPHAVLQSPLAQTVFAGEPGQVFPEATHPFAWQHPPLAQAASGEGQQRLPGDPHPVQAPPVQIVSAPLHGVSLAKHLSAVVSQQSPLAVQVVPPQHACPVSPHEEQVPPMHVRPEPVHTLPAQQGSPLAPHAAHEPPEHTSAALEQALPLVQHGSPLAPHEEHVPLTHASVPASVVELHSPASLPQHGCALSPHVAHEPFEHTVTAPASLLEQAPPVSTQVPFAGSQQPLGHVAFAQQMSPRTPQATHDPLLQIVFAIWQSMPCPTQ
jgi:hypothetical protein